MKLNMRTLKDALVKVGVALVVAGFLGALLRDVSLMAAAGAGLMGTVFIIIGAIEEDK